MSYQMKELKKATRTFQNTVDNFDYERVHALMVVSCWNDTDGIIPTVSMLKFKANAIFQALCDNDRPNTRVSSMGFVMTRFVYDTSICFDMGFQWQFSSDSTSVLECTD